MPSAYACFLGFVFRHEFLKIWLENTKCRTALKELKILSWLRHNSGKKRNVGNGLAKLFIKLWTIAHNGWQPPEGRDFYHKT